MLSVRARRILKTHGFTIETAPASEAELRKLPGCGLLSATEIIAAKYDLEKLKAETRRVAALKPTDDARLVAELTGIRKALTFIGGELQALRKMNEKVYSG